MEEDDFEHENTLESNSDVMGSKTEEISELTLGRAGQAMRYIHMC